MNQHSHPGSGMETVTFRSTGGLFPHTHTLEITRSDLLDPPTDGLLLTTSREYSLIFKHRHQVRVSHEDLERVRSGGEVTVSDTDKRRHQFKLSLK